MNEFAAGFESFVLLSLEKYQQFSHMGPWSATYHPGKLTLRRAGETAFVFAEYFQNRLYTCF